MGEHHHLPNNSYHHRPRYPTIFVSHLENIATQTMPNTARNWKLRRATLSDYLRSNHSTPTPAGVSPQTSTLMQLPAFRSIPWNLKTHCSGWDRVHRPDRILRSSFSSRHAATPGWTLHANQYPFVALVRAHCCWKIGNQIRQDHRESIESEIPGTMAVVLENKPDFVDCDTRSSIRRPASFGKNGIGRRRWDGWFEMCVMDFFRCVAQILGGWDCSWTKGPLETAVVGILVGNAVRVSYRYMF
mmetsp:Transcript_30617/g.37272  ORF Transcript_30617/g.37272 Transcript_30617/m.37272 type:complete len:244 (+) Transcript_30617:1272-2003(+)